MNGNHSISEVSSIAGIPKDLLRMWERRYGYPQPLRNSHGDRIYTDEQLEKLILIRQLQEQGKRPGKLMQLDISQLKALRQAPAPSVDLERLAVLLKAGDAGKLSSWLREQLLALGLRSFIHRIMVPANKLVGEAWSQGEMAIFEEHLYTELMKNLIRQSLSEQQLENRGPRVMLTTVPGEKHSLGLLMVEALLRLGGAQVITFGVEMPFRDIREAALGHQVEIIGLSFSAGFKPEDALVMLSGLRQIVDRKVRIWVGGGAFDGIIEMPEGVEQLAGLHAVETALLEWRQSSRES